MSRRTLRSTERQYGIEVARVRPTYILKTGTPMRPKRSTSSPRVTHLSWGRIELDDNRSFKDAKLFPGGAREWDWRETGTDHVPGIQPADVEELLGHGAKVVILSQGMYQRLQVRPETLDLLREKDVKTHVLQTEEAVRLYNELREKESVAGLFHSTC